MEIRTQEQIKECLRRDFNLLHPLVQEYEAKRMARIVKNKPIYLIDSGEEVVAATDVTGIIRTVKSLTGKTPIRENVYQCIAKNPPGTIFGCKIERYFEKEDAK